MFFTRTTSRFLSGRITLLLVLIFSCIGAIQAHAADLSFSPSQGNYQEGQTFTVDIYVSNNTESINAVSGTVSFPASKLTIRSLSKEGSIIKLWAEEPSYSNTTGTIKFEGIILNPGFSGPRGKVISIVFSAKTEGIAPVSFSSGEILANDGNATSVLKNLGTASYQVNGEVQIEPAAAKAPTTSSASSQAGASTVPSITSDTHPNEESWYNSRTARFAWKVPSTVTAVRTLYDEKPNSVPTRVYDPPVTSRSFTTEEDGIMYMHVQFKTEEGWGTPSHRKFQIDTTEPSSIEVKLPLGDRTTDSTPEIFIEAKDSLSGIGRIAISADGGGVKEYPFVQSNLYILDKLVPGKHTLSIIAYDLAGNPIETTRELTIEKLAPPTIEHYTKRAEYGDDLVVSGSAHPHKTVEIRLVDEKNRVETKSTTSDENGDFTAIWKDTLQSGIYEMTARTVDENGATSDFTEGRTVIVDDMKLIRVGMFIMNWLSLALIIVLASMLVIATFWYSLTQFARFRRKVHQTMQEAEHTLKVNVKALRRDSEEFHSLLLKAQKKRELTKEEAAIMKKFKKRLDITEKEIEKKLEQIG